MSVYAKGGYLDQKTRSPLSLGAALAVNGIMVGALVFMSPTVREKIPTILDTINIPIETPPEPVKPEPQKQRQEQKVMDRIAVADPPVSRPDTTFTLPKLPDIPIPSGRGVSETGVTVVAPPEPHVPVFRASGIDKRYVAALQPPYPPGKIRSGEEGVVVVRVLVGPDGRVKDVQKVEAADEVFFRATAEQAMKRWRFTPATSDGTPVESWRTMTVRFKLDT